MIHISVFNIKISVSLFKVCVGFFFPLRHWHSSTAYAIANEASSADMPAANHRVYRWPEDLPQPSVVIFLTVTEEVRVARLHRRDGEQSTLEEKNLARDREFRHRLVFIRDVLLLSQFSCRSSSKLLL